ncbi:MAG TPA: non-homologous end-joining DNA ligase [Gemmatimonadaceae bacterium]|jgi:bifunctional non-homologous end joining protein LigD|nr:non-homologous end-joining DNA ligase [Gemmatimonadaceae bacterium]
MTPRKLSADFGDVESQLRTIERGADDGEIVIGKNARLHVSSLSKPFFPDAGITKGGLMRYYTRVAPLLLPELEGRALVLKRYPNGVDGPMFFQQNAGDHVPDEVRVATLDTVELGAKPRIIGGDLLTLLYTVQLGAIEVHPWLSRVDDVDTPDRCLIDLDPGDDVPFGTVAMLARAIARIAEGCGLPVAIKTSGASGLHIVLPLAPRTTYETSAALALRLAEAAVAAHPDIATVERSVKARPKGSIYVDALQNARGKSMAAPYSVRARATASVSAPLRERELTGRLRIDAFTVRSMPARLARTGDLWGDAIATRPTARAIARAMAALDDTASAPPPSTARTVRTTAGGPHAGSTSRRRARSA